MGTQILTLGSAIPEIGLTLGTGADLLVPLLLALGLAVAGIWTALPRKPRRATLRLAHHTR